MKTSNKWLLAALLLLLGSLSAYNMGLRAEYASSAYKDPLRNTTTLNFKDFSEVDVQGASLMNVKVVAGPYNLRVDKKAAQYVKVSQQGARLTIALVFPKDREWLGGGEVLTITCPQLKKLTAGAEYSAAGKAQKDRNRGRGNVRIQGFRQDSLLVQHDYSTQVELSDNQLAYLRAETGRRPGSTSVLHIEKSNRIQAADLTVQAKSELKLEAGGIDQLSTQFGDSATATLAGAGLGSLSRR
jgi:hypothetical protein